MSFMLKINRNAPATRAPDGREAFRSALDAAIAAARQAGIHDREIATNLTQIADAMAIRHAMTAPAGKSWH